MKKFKIIQQFLLVALTLSVVSCSSENISYEYPQDPQNKRKMRAGKLFTENDEDIVLFGEKEEKNEQSENITPQEVQEEIQKTQSIQLNINKQLWQASLEVVSAKLPISLMDSNAGLIVSDWGMMNGNANEQYKINVLVKGEELSQDSVIVSVFKQAKTNGQWENVNTDGSLKKEIEEQILKRAKEINHF